MRQIVNALVVSMVVALPASAGLHFEAVTRTVGDDETTTQVFVVESWVEGESARVEFREVKGAPVPAGGYLVTNDGGRTLFMIDPEKREYMRWDLDAMLQTLSAVMQSTGGMVSLEFSDAKLESRGSDPGPELLGHPTTEHRFHRSYRMEMKIIGMRRAYDVSSEEQVWTTTELDAPGLFAWLRTTPPKTGNEGLDRMISSGMAAIEGVPLKTVSRSTTTDSKGKVQRSASTMEVTRIDEVETEAAMFEIPAGYRQVEMPTMAGDGGAAEPEEGGGKGLLGLFKKKK